MNLVMVALGGAIGASARYLLGLWAVRTLGTGFPWGTLIVNVAGAFVMGLAAVVLLERPGTWAQFAPLVMTGMLGGFTTFSAFSLDALFLMERGRVTLAALYVGASVLLSIGALWLALMLARAMLRSG